MRRVAAGVLVVLLAGMALLSVGCVDENKYNAVLLRNREQEKLLQEKEAQAATLNERVSALTARAGDAQRLLAEKEDHLAAVMKERDEVRRAFNQLMDAYKKIAERAPMVTPTGIRPEVQVALQDLEKQYPGVFKFDPATGCLHFVADLTFDSGSNVVKPEAKAAITKLGAILTSDAAKDLRVDIIGHTDTDPVKKPQTVALLKELRKPSNNMGLSEARAESVADILKAANVEAGRITTSGKGESQPVADNRTAEGKAKNRRVDIFLSAAASAVPTTAAPPAPAMK